MNDSVPVLGNTVTVMSPDGKPVTVNASALQAAAAQNAVGRFPYLIILESLNCPRIVIVLQRHSVAKPWTMYSRINVDFVYFSKI